MSSNGASEHATGKMTGESSPKAAGSASKFYVDKTTHNNPHGGNLGHGAVPMPLTATSNETNGTIGLTKAPGRNANLTHGNDGKEIPADVATNNNDFIDGCSSVIIDGCSSVDNVLQHASPNNNPFTVSNNMSPNSNNCCPGAIGHNVATLEHPCFNASVHQSHPNAIFNHPLANRNQTYQHPNWGFNHPHPHADPNNHSHQCCGPYVNHPHQCPGANWTFQNPVFACPPHQNLGPCYPHPSVGVNCHDTNMGLNMNANMSVYPPHQPAGFTPRHPHPGTNHLDLHPQQNPFCQIANSNHCPHPNPVVYQTGETPCSNVVSHHGMTYWAGVLVHTTTAVEISCHPLPNGGHPLHPFHAPQPPDGHPHANWAVAPHPHPNVGQPNPCNGHGISPPHQDLGVGPPQGVVPDKNRSSTIQESLVPATDSTKNNFSAGDVDDDSTATDDAISEEEKDKDVPGTKVDSMNSRHRGNFQHSRGRSSSETAKVPSTQKPVGKAKLPDSTQEEIPGDHLEQVSARERKEETTATTNTTTKKSEQQHDENKSEQRRGVNRTSKIWEPQDDAFLIPQRNPDIFREEPFEPTSDTAIHFDYDDFRKSLREIAIPKIKTREHTNMKCPWTQVTAPMKLPKEDTDNQVLFTLFGERMPDQESLQRRDGKLKFELYGEDVAKWLGCHPSNAPPSRTACGDLLPAPFYIHPVPSRCRAMAKKILAMQGREPYAWAVFQQLVAWYNPKTQKLTCKFRTRVVGEGEPVGEHEEPLSVTTMRTIGCEDLIGLR